MPSPEYSPVVVVDVALEVVAAAAAGVVNVVVGVSATGVVDVVVGVSAIGVVVVVAGVSTTAAAGDEATATATVVSAGSCATACVAGALSEVVVGTGAEIWTVGVVD